MSLDEFPIISLVAVCDSNNDVGGEKCDTGWEQIFSSFSETNEITHNRHLRYLPHLEKLQCTVTCLEIVKS